MTDLERLQQENAQLNRQVTDLQQRCTELLEEKRRANVDYAVREFHLKYGHPAPGRLTMPDEAMIRFRARLVTEEYLELLDAMFAAKALPEWDGIKRALRHITEIAPVDVDLVEWADATHDLDYVVAGTRVVFGYNGAPGAAEVHRSNMAKIPNGLDKPIKPEGWTPPDIAGVLRAQGWKSSRFEAQENPFVRRMREIPIELDDKQRAKVDEIFKDWKTEKFVSDPLSPDADSRDTKGGDCAGPVFPNGAVAEHRVLPTKEEIKSLYMESKKRSPWKGRIDPELAAAATGPFVKGVITQVVDKFIEDSLRAALFDFLSDWRIAPAEIRAGDTARTSDVDELLAIFRNFGWRSIKGREQRFVAAQRVLQKAAKGLRKLAAKYPEMPADNECGEVSRGYYEMLAEQLEKLT